MGDKRRAETVEPRGRARRRPGRAAGGRASASAARPGVPRAYLRAAERRGQLLDAAARLVGERGWSALGMIPLAEAAGVSRQLVYEHFSGTADLMVEVMRHLFEGAREATARVVSGEARGVGAVVRLAYEIYLDLPSAQRRALRALAGDSEPGSPEVERARQRMRGEILGLWAPYVRGQTDLSEPMAGALAWMLTVAAWGLTDLVEEGAVGGEDAKRLLAELAEQAVAARGKRGRARRSRPAR